jgi:hypothetical protein
MMKNKLASLSSYTRIVFVSHFAGVYSTINKGLQSNTGLNLILY